jgi:hypothetical protein
MKIISIIAFLALLIMPCIAEELGAGNANFDLGDGYEASFVLPDIGKPYDVEISSPSINEFMKQTTYGFSVSSDGNELATVSMYVYQSPQLNPVPKASTEPENAASKSMGMGSRIKIPKTISGAQGYVGYDLPMGATGTDTSNAMTGFFRCFPGARKVSDALGDSLESSVEVSGETGGFPSSAQSLQVFNSLVDSIKITGPGI